MKLSNLYKRLLNKMLKPILLHETKTKEKIPNERPVESTFLFKHLSKIYPKEILDVGSGETSLPHLLSNCGFSIVAIDKKRGYNDENVFFNRHYYIQEDDITNTKINKKFDFISCISTLEHIKESDQAVSNMVKLLKPNGYLLLTFPYNENKYHHNVYEIPECNMKEIRHIAQAFSRNELLKWKKEHNLKIIDQEYYQFYTGEYWKCRESILPPKKVRKEEKHQISCVLFQANSGKKN